MEESPWNLREFLYKKNLNLYKFHKSLYKNQVFLQEVLEKTCPDFSGKVKAIYEVHRREWG